MVTRNDYRQELFNGDVGIVVQDSTSNGLAVLFEEPAAEGGCRLVPAALVPEMKTCFALTIHKCQGSEYHRVMVVLPDRNSPILTRELLYTAVTRVSDEIDPETGNRHSGTLYLSATEMVVRQTIERQIRRTSGLRDAIEALNEIRILAHIDEGTRQLREGNFVEFDQDGLRNFFDEIQASGRRRYEECQKRS